MSDAIQVNGVQSGKPDGVLLLDKPVGLSSNAAVQAVRRYFGRAKAGHTGTLDPLASGLLPVCLGEATKFSHPLLDADKSYTASLCLGWRSTTGDAEGELRRGSAPDFGESELREAVLALSGDIEQVPPMYSAIKVDGQPLYARARKGMHVERAPRHVRVERFEITQRTAGSLDISVSCSKGTYIRVLAEDLGERLGCGAYLTALRRVAIGSIDIDQAVGFDALESASDAQRLAMLRPIDLFLGSLPKVTLTMDDCMRLGHGLSIPGIGHGAEPLVRIYAGDGRFLGLGEICEDGSLKSRRLVSTAF